MSPIGSLSGQLINRFHKSLLKDLSFIELGFLSCSLIVIFSITILLLICSLRNGFYFLASRTQHPHMSESDSNMTIQQSEVLRQSFSLLTDDDDDDGDDH